MSRSAISRFLTYSLIGTSTFGFDLLLLYVLKEFVGVHYAVAAAIAFLCAVSVNYVVSRRVVFAGTTRTVGTGYAYFMLIAGGGLLVVTSSVLVLVEWFGLHYLVSRISVAGLVGLGNYLINLYFNFKVAGQYGAVEKGI